MNARREHERPVEHILFLAVTRPALYAGVPIEAAFMCAMGGLGASWMLFDFIWFFPGTFVGWGLCAAVARNDPLMFRVLMLWLMTRPKCPDAGRRSTKHWGGISLSPLRPVRLYGRKDLGRNV